ncbi:MAG: hypothetical protein RLZZ528_2789 [Pseudomonadota bacterium]
MGRHIASNFLTLLVVILIAAAGAVAWAQRQYTGPGPLADAICLRVEPGSNFRKVADSLVAQGAVSSGYILKVGADYEEKSAGLKAGSFLIPPKASMQEIAAAITGDGQSTCGTEINYRIGVLAGDIVVRELDPATNAYVEVAKFDPASEPVPEVYAERLDDPSVRLRVTLAEGATSWQAVEGLKAIEILTGEVSAVPGEGRLAPDSYEIARGDTRADLIEEMQRRQDAALAKAWDERAADLPYETPEEALVMASIVEKETGIPEERRQVASVFVNRLRQGMKLQTDPTVIYGLTKGQGALGRGLRQSELRSDTPYNTYVIEGLPPTPIANPGLASIEAALNPDSTDYLFFVADGSGGHAFAETLDEHNENVARWREIEAQRGEEAEGGAQDGG